MNNKILLEIQNVVKHYPGVKALDNVSLNINEGEVMALLGENGAGKSTLMKILSGAISRDSGEIKIANKSMPKKNTPLSARNFGIAIIYQELSLLSELSVSENIYLTHEPVKNGCFIDYKKMNELALIQLKKFGADYIDVSKKALTLPLPEQQMAEIAKALAVDCKVIIMDEPTTSLTWEETERLFDVVRTLKKNKITVIYISHRLDEIFKIADTATVMRDGRIVGKVDIKKTNSDEIVEMMTGKLLEHKKKSDEVCKVLYNDDNCVFEAIKISDGKYIKDISFKLYKNEILGFAGLIGSRRTETARMIFGCDKLKSGEIIIDGKSVVNKTPSQAIKNKIGYLSENRKEEGLNLGMSLKENIALTDMKSVSKRHFIDFKKISSVFNSYKKSINIKGFENSLVSSLSGGNQQKVAIAKWLHSGCDILIFDEPTRGIDVAAKAEIYKLIRNFANEHKGAIVISSDAPEIVDVCDRVLIVSKGEIVEEIKNEYISQENVLKSIVERKKEETNA